MKGNEKLFGIAWFVTLACGIAFWGVFIWAMVELVKWVTR